MTRPAVVLLALVLGWPTLGMAQGDCFPGPESNEAKTMGIFAVPLAFSRGSAPDRFPGFNAGLELAYLPKVSDALATPTICRPGKGPEHTDLLFAIPRPRFGMPLPLGLTLQASWIPPVRVNGVKANLFGVSLEKSFGGLGGLVAAVRAHATFGSIHAPIVCDDAALRDVTSECFGGTRSDDRISPNIMGLDLAVGGSMAGGRLRPYGGAGYNRLQPRFQVDFTNRFGETDHRRVTVNLDRLVLFGGATWQLAGRLGLTGELYAAPSDAVTGRLIVRTAVGP
ncbi:MAG TPA: hypothetical protein VK535_11305 [Gemmatimonadales bacterium]|nr:hypothetical protein [Gemmatimonadales bacterium]